MYKSIWNDAKAKHKQMREITFLTSYLYEYRLSKIKNF